MKVDPLSVCTKWVKPRKFQLECCVTNPQDKGSCFYFRIFSFFLRQKAASTYDVFPSFRKTFLNNWETAVRNIPEGCYLLTCIWSSSLLICCIDLSPGAVQSEPSSGYCHVLTGANWSKNLEKLYVFFTGRWPILCVIWLACSGDYENEQVLLVDYMTG